MLKERAGTVDPYQGFVSAREKNGFYMFLFFARVQRGSAWAPPPAHRGSVQSPVRGGAQHGSLFFCTKFGIPKFGLSHSPAYAPERPITDHLASALGALETEGALGTGGESIGARD